MVEVEVKLTEDTITVVLLLNKRESLVLKASICLTVVKRHQLIK